TLLTTVCVVSTETTWPARPWLGRASRVTVAGWPAWILAASASLKPATTCSTSRSTSVMKPLAELPEVPLPAELEEPPPPLAPPPLDDCDEPDDDELEAPPPELPTNSPTLLEMADTVPSAGAV